MSSHGVVKQVISGDTITVLGQARAGGPPPERTLSIAYITAPRLARRPNAKGEQETKDEPFAWESREFLRKRLVGKPVEFTVEYKVPSGREYATILVGPSKENLAQLLVRAGLASSREGGKGQPNQQQQDLAALQAQAQAEKKGIHGGPEAAAKAVRKVEWTVENLRGLVDSSKGNPIDAVIENIRDACTFRVTLLPSFQNVTVVLSGIKTPTFKRNGEQEVAEPLAEEARFYTEIRLLQRDVKILLEGVSGANVLGTVLHPAGNISELLLQQGYAKIVDWSFGNVTNGREKLRAAETAAKSARLRVWADHKVSERSEIEDREFTAPVEEIVSAECIVVNHKGRSRKIFLASIRQPKPKEDVGSAAGGAGAGAGAGAAPASAKKRLNYWEIPWGFEARDFLRKKLVGQKAQIHIDYIKPGTDGMPERVCCTVKIDGVNVGEALVTKGLASVVRYRESDPDRASSYDDLLAAESKAIKGLKGIHSGKEAPVHRINDVGSRAVAEKLLPGFQRTGRLQGVVEYVQSGSRLRVFLSRDSCLVTVLLAGLSCPRPATSDKPADPFGEEALALIRGMVLQHEVEVELEDIDKSGAFVGHVYLGSTNVAVPLLTEGYAKLHPSADKYKNLGQLQVAEAGAKDARRNAWAGYVEPVAVVKEETTESSTRKIDYQPVIVTEVSSATTFWGQKPASKSTLDNILHTISTAFTANPPVGASKNPKRNELIAAKFSADGNWYRARVQKVNSPTDIAVLYVDFGNSESVTNKDIASLPSGVSGPALATEYHIAFLQPPPADWAAESAESLRRRILNQTVKVNVEYRDAAAEYVTVQDDAGVDVGAELVEDGVVTYKPRSSPHLQKIMETYAAAQKKAKTERRALWQYGDITNDEQDN